MLCSSSLPSHRLLMMEQTAISYFQEYLRIPSVHPDIDYSECVKFLKRLADEIGLDSCVHNIVEGKPIVIMTWKGIDNHAGSILLNSHMDVVPVKKEKWKYDPFGAVKDNEGNIYARGSQDCKNIGIQYLMAIKCLMDEGFKPKRTVYLSYVPEEEVGGLEGMGSFVRTEEFTKMNVEFALDEGGPWPKNAFVVSNKERQNVAMKITCRGKEGHGSLLYPNTAGEKLWKVMDSIMQFRENQVKLSASSLQNLADVTTINLTMVEGGIQTNVVPSEFILTFDIRLSIDKTVEEFLDWVQEVCTSAGEDVSYELLNDDWSLKTKLLKFDELNPFWITFKQVFHELKEELVEIVMPATTDSRFLRAVNIPSIGFNPIKNSPVLAHADNEMLNEKMFFEGIDVYKHIIKALVNV